VAVGVIQAQPIGQPNGLVSIGIGEMHAARSGLIRTCGLGSCIAVCLADPSRGVAGMLHQLLPASSVNPERAGREPGAFADTGIPLLVKKLAELGAPSRSLKATLVGGAAMGFASSPAFQIGKRNVLAARQVLWQLGIAVRAEEVGGAIPRTAEIDVKTGFVVVRVPGEPDRRVG
jgi:chemotaxis protein CheD